jgi:glycosyltransferase involved in cell wall biosynthesis
MKINHVIWLHSHFLYWMGGTKFVHHVISELKKNKNIKRITVIVENTSDFSMKQYSDINVELISLNSSSSNNPLYWLFLPFILTKNYFKIKKIYLNYKLTKENSVTFSGMFPMNVVANFLNTNHVQNCFEPFAFFYDNNFISQFHPLKKKFIQILKIIYSPIDIWATKRSLNVLTLNNTTQRMIANIYSIKSIKTQAGVKSSLFKPYISKTIKNKYKNKVVAIHSTDYSPIKRTDLVIKSFAKATKNINNALLLITSTIYNETRQNKLIYLSDSLGIKNKVIFLGFLPIIELPQYYSLANVMIQGAFSEKSGTTSMSLPVKEAMCCETPAIRPDLGGEDVEHGKTGFLVDPRDTSLVAKKISILLKDSKLSNSMGKRARKFIVKKYTWKNTAQIFIKQIQELT